jgi:hypothetical protein
MSDNLINTTAKDLKDILEIVHFIKDTAASQESVDLVKADLAGVKADLAARIDGLESRLGSVEAKMVTKDYLDDKLADLRGDMVVLMRKEDEKLKVLAGNLKDKKILTPEDEEKLQRLEPFAQAKY